ncbi:MAG: hypothetical protein QM775_02625 [Pirellulales bacterium]
MTERIARPLPSTTTARSILSALTLFTTCFAAWTFADVAAADGFSPLDGMSLVLFVALFVWVAMSFWMATIGFLPPGASGLGRSQRAE